MDCQHLQIQRHSPIIHATTRSSLLHRNTACTLHVLIIWMTNTFWPIFAFLLGLDATCACTVTRCQFCGQTLKPAAKVFKTKNGFVRSRGPDRPVLMSESLDHNIVYCVETSGYLRAKELLFTPPSPPPRAKQHILFLHCVAKNRTATINIVHFSIDAVKCF